MKKNLTKHLIAVMVVASALANKAIAGNVYNYTGPTGSTWAFVDNATQWNALFSAGAVQANDEYVIPSNATIVIGSTTSGTHIVDLTSAIKNITVQGRLGFRANGNQVIKLNPGAEVSVAAGGLVGFYEVYAAAPGNGYGNWYGNSSEHIVFVNGAGDPYVFGPFLVIGPETINISDAAVGGAAAPVSRIWKGSAGINGTKWNVATNWVDVPGSGSSVPGSGDNVIIPTTPVGAVVFPELELSAAVTVHDLVVETGATIGIDATSSLTVTGNIYNIGDITVQSGGALVQTVGSTLVTTEGSNTGVFNIERDLSGQVSPWYMGSPINSLSKAGFSGCGNGQFVPGATCDAPVLGGTSLCVMSTNQDNNTTGINCSHSLWNYESGGSFTNGKGYAFYRPANVLTFSGQNVNNGAVSYGPLGYSVKGAVNLPAGFVGTTTRGWHMVSNPYPSPLELTSAERLAMGFDAQMQLWDSDLGNWVSPAPGATVTVAVGQAFQIRVTNDGTPTATFAVDNSQRTATTGATFYKTDDNNSYLNVTLTEGTYTSTAHVYFVDGATDAFDAAYDANRLFGLVERPYVYTLEQNGEFLSYNGLPLLNSGSTKSVPLSVHVGANGNHTLTFEGVDLTNATVVLEDLTTGSMYPVTEGYVHSFTAQTTDNPNRFTLHFNAAAISGIQTAANNQVSLFPNPTTGRATVMLAANSGFSKIVVLDLAGKVVYADAIGSNESNKTFNISEFASGIYTVKLVGDVTVTRKLIKQ